MLRQRAYAAEINVAFQALEENNLNRALELLDRQRPASGEEDLRGFEWQYLWKCCQSNEIASFEDQARTSAAFSRDGRYFALAGDGGIIVRDVVSQLVVTELSESVRTVAFSPTDDLMVCANQTVSVWDVKTWRKIRSLPESRFPAVFSPDGRLLASTAMEEHIVCLWEIPSGKLQAVLKGHAASVWYVAFTPDGKTLATCSDNCVKLWNMATKQEVAAFSDEALIWSMGFSPDGRTLAIGCGGLDMALEKHIRLFQVPSFEEIADIEAKEKALMMLARIDKLRRAANNESNPVELASIVISLHQLGSAKEAVSALEKLRGMFENGKNSEFLKWLCGAEKVFAGENSSIRHIWECIELGKLNDAWQLIEEHRSLPLQQDDDISGSIARATRALAGAYYERGISAGYSGRQYSEAISDYETAVRVDPNYARAFSDLAWLRAAYPATDFRDEVKAIENATKACELTNWKDHLYVGILAAVYAEVGDFENAVKWQKEATDLLTEDNRANWQAIYESRLKLYQSDKPYDGGYLWSFSTGRMIGWWKFDEDSGSIVVDWSGHGNHGTLEGDPQWVDGIIGGALDLDETDFVTIDSIVDDITSSNITVSAWVKTTSAIEEELFASNTTGSSHPFMFGITDGSVFIYDDSNEEGHTPITVNDDRWHMWTYVRRGTTGYIYVDAVQQSSHSADFVLASLPRWSIGQEWDGSEPSNFLTGTVDDARFYTYSLSEAEIKAIYAGRNPDPTEN
jgi:WD40 repeat protein